MKIQIQKLKSSKLFYKKWPFKVECNVTGANLINIRGVGNVLNFCASNITEKGINKSELMNFTLAVKPFLKRKDIRIRTESSHFNIFCNNFADLEEINQALDHWITKISGPTTKEELEFLLDNGPKKILCDKLPKDSFKYRIYFKSKWNLDKRSVFFQWAKNYRDKIIISKTSELWLTGQRMWAQDPFAYVKDDKTLSMIGLQVTGNVKLVEQFIERNQALVA